MHSVNEPGKGDIGPVWDENELSMAFIVFEGLDGAGKSTLINKLAERLEESSEEVVLTREPGGTELGEEVRSILLRVEGEDPTALAELLLYEAGRAQHVETKIKPALDRGAWVICDRYAASSVAFQSGGRQLSEELIHKLNDIATGGLAPDVVVLLDLTVEEAKRRMEGRDLDRFELEKQDFHNRVRESYLSQAKAQSERWLVLNAAKTVEELVVELFAGLKEKKCLK
jgi:dTMP kinase